MNTTLQSFDSGSNYRFGDKMQQANFPRSMFDLSCLVTTTIDNAGVVFPIKVIPTLPSDDFDISVRSLVRVLSQVVPLYSRQRLYIYGMYSRLSDLYQNFGTFITKGYSGKVDDKHIPVIDQTKNLLVDGNDKNVAPMSLADCFDIPVGFDISKLDKLISALPAMMYLRVWRDYFCNRNHWIDDRVILPDDDTRFRLGDDGRLLSAVDAGVDFRFQLNKYYVDGYSGYDPEDPEPMATFGMFCHDYPDDYFTSALPFPQRGKEASINIDLSGSSAYADLSGSRIFQNSDGEPSSVASAIVGYISASAAGWSTLGETIPLSKVSGYGGVSSLGIPSSDSTSALTVGRFEEAQSSALTSRFPVSLDSANFGLTLNALRTLAVAETEMEKMALTDGSWASFGITFFGERPKNANDFRPVYIGGTYVNLQFTEVLQTSAQYENDQGEIKPVGSPLGTYGGHGIGSDNTGYIGHVHCDDYGYIMILGCIMPDVYYSQGLPLHLTTLNQDEFFLPERAKLGMKPIYNRELFLQGTSDDNDLWAWQSIFDEYRYLPSTIHGKIADKDSFDFVPYTQARFFESLPNYGHLFAEANNVRKDYLASYDEVAYTAQFALDVRAVRPLPYKAIPANILD